MDQEAEFKTIRQKQNKQRKRTDKTTEIQGINVQETMIDQPVQTSPANPVPGVS